MIADEALQKRMEYLQDVAGWKSIIFLPFQFIWQCVIMLSALYVFLTSTNRVTFKVETSLEFTLGYLCDILYFVDVICSVLHHALANTRKLKNYKSRSWILILIDNFSLIPFELIYTAVYMSEKPHSREIWYYMFLNRVLRMYRIYYYFNEYEISVNSINLGVLSIFLRLYIYALCIIHVATSIYHNAKNEQEINDFWKSPIENIFIEEIYMYFLMSQRFVGNKSFYDTTKKRIFFIIFMMVGYFYLYAVAVPKVMFAIQRKHRTFFDFWNRFKRLKKFINNVLEDKALEATILDMFRTVWTYGKGDFEPELLQTYPMNMQKNAYSDMYWDALRHSDLLQNVSKSCKRALALRIIGNFYEPNTIFWELEENKNIMMYIASGILQIMAVENEESPIMSFSGGTVFGETSIYYPDRSKAILRVATFSEIHILQAKDFFRVIKDYPKDRKIVLQNLKLRLKIARMTQLRRKEINTILQKRRTGDLGNDVADKVDSVKWIKAQFRRIGRIEEMKSKLGKDYSGMGIYPLLNQQLNQMMTGIDHTSLFLPLLNLGGDIEVITDQTCLKTTIPWVIDPNSPFTRHWRLLTLFFVVFSSLTYPIFIAWWPIVPDWLVSLSALISLFYLCDIFIQISTAIKTKGELIAKSGPIFRYRLKRLSFYADIISAIPYQVICHYFWLGDNVEDIVMRVSIAISLMKTYRLISFMEEWCHTLKGRISIRVMAKHLFYTLLLTYWTAAFLHLSDVRCLFWTCNKNGWYYEPLEQLYPGYRNMASSFFAMAYLLGVSSAYDHSQSLPTAPFITVTLTIMQFILLTWSGEFAGAYLSESSQEIKFNNLLQSINSYMTERKMVERIMKRVWDTLQFQWVYDCGDYLTQERGMLEDVPVKLKTEVDRSTIFKILRTCKVFESESDTLIWYLCSKSSRLALPAGSVVVTFGTQTMTVYAVYKGYLEVNSFLPKDIRDGIATPALYGPGKIVPIVITLNQMPSGVTARTLTDCELIVIPLETLLTGLIFNDCLKDFVEAIKELDLQPFRKSRLAFSRVAKSSRKDTYYKKPFKNISYFGWVLRILLMGSTINGTGKFYMQWETFRIIIIIIETSVWPFVFILPPSQDRSYLIYALLGLESFTWFDFYIKMHVGYYNSKGIYISHPLSTSAHYISTSLILELLVFTPYLHSIYVIVTNPNFDATNAFVLGHSFVRLFTLYRVFLFAKNYSERGTSSIFKTIGISVIIIVGLNDFIVLKIWSEIVWVTYSNGTTIQKFTTTSWVSAVDIPVGTLPEIYLVMFYCVVMLIYRGDVFVTGYSLTILVLELILIISGFILSFLLLAIILSRKAGSKMNFIMYQYHMKSLSHFLKVEKADDNMSKEAINHFEHEWEKRKGDDLHTVFRRFPNILYEDMMYPVYRKIFLGLPCFKYANDGFFRSLFRKFVEVHFRKGSVISFEKAVHKNIYFILSGLCHVEEVNVTLGEGSIMGDIKGRGIMTNNIRAQTHVVLLTITSQEFFGILNNFAGTEGAFFNAIKDVEDYVKSIYDIPAEIQSEDPNDWMVVKKKFEECEFELDVENKEKSADVDKKTRIKIRFGNYINPNSRSAKILMMIFMMDAIITAFVIPVIMALELRNYTMTVLVHSLDAIWFIKIIATFRTAYIEPETGNMVKNKKKIFRNYLKSLDGLLIDILCILPFEYVYKITRYFDPNWSWYWVFEKYCYSGRLLRLFTLWIRVKKEKSKLSLKDRTRWVIIIVRALILYNFLTAINIIIATDKKIEIEPQNENSATFLFEVFIWNFLSMFNLYAGTGLYLFHPSNMLQLTFHVFICMFALIDKCALVSEVLAIIQASMFVKSEKLYRMQLMDKFLEVRDVSPFLRKTLMKYACDLLIHFKGEVEPLFLRTAPYYIRVEIMQDLYLEYLSRCYVFHEIPPVFLKQLAARLQRHVFFPSDVITEKEDVDCCMYFVHNGEVVSIESDSIYHGLYYETGRYGVGDYFGLEQGLSRRIPQSTTYRALTKVDLLILNYFQWEDLRLAFPGVMEIIQKRMEVKKTEN